MNRNEEVGEKQQELCMFRFVCPRVLYCKNRRKQVEGEAIRNKGYNNNKNNKSNESSRMFGVQVVAALPLLRRHILQLLFLVLWWLCLVPASYAEAASSIPTNKAFVMERSIPIWFRLSFVNNDSNDSNNNRNDGYWQNYVRRANAGGASTTGASAGAGVEWLIHVLNQQERDIRRSMVETIVERYYYGADGSSTSLSVTPEDVTFVLPSTIRFTIVPNRNQKNDYGMISMMTTGGSTDESITATTTTTNLPPSSTGLYYEGSTTKATSGTTTTTTTFVQQLNLWISEINIPITTTTTHDDVPLFLTDHHLRTFLAPYFDGSTFLSSLMSMPQQQVTYFTSKSSISFLMSYQHYGTIKPSTTTSSTTTSSMSSTTTATATQYHMSPLYLELKTRSSSSKTLQRLNVFQATIVRQALNTFFLNVIFPNHIIPILEEDEDRLLSVSKSLVLGYYSPFYDYTHHDDDKNTVVPSPNVWSFMTSASPQDDSIIIVDEQILTQNSKTLVIRYDVDMILHWFISPSSQKYDDPFQVQAIIRQAILQSFDNNVFLPYLKQQQQQAAVVAAATTDPQDTMMAAAALYFNDITSTSISNKKPTTTPSPAVFACFSGRSTVMLQNGTILPMYQLQMGDMVLVGSAAADAGSASVRSNHHHHHRYEPIYSFGHYKNQDDDHYDFIHNIMKSVSFLKIVILYNNGTRTTAPTWIHHNNSTTTATAATTPKNPTHIMTETLEVSSNHLIYVSSSHDDYVPASQVTVGDILRIFPPHDNAQQQQYYASVISIETVPTQEYKYFHGIYAPFTPSGTIVVNHILSSSYIEITRQNPTTTTTTILPQQRHEQQETSRNNMLTSFIHYHFPSFRISSQWMAHASQAPHRMACYHLKVKWNISFLCPTDETYTQEGISTRVVQPLELMLKVSNYYHYPRDGTMDPKDHDEHSKLFLPTMGWIIVIIVLGILSLSETLCLSITQFNQPSSSSLSSSFVCWILIFLLWVSFPYIISCRRKAKMKQAEKIGPLVPID